MSRFILLVLLAQMYSCSMITPCQFIYRVPGDDPRVPSNMCMRNGYSFSDGAIIRTPFADCNMCRCNNGVLKCCLYGIKRAPVAVPNWCEVHLINGTCDYEVVFKTDRNRPCFPFS